MVRLVRMVGEGIRRLGDRLDTAQNILLAIAVIVVIVLIISGILPINKVVEWIENILGVK